jgi:hypothetical protein
LGSAEYKILRAAVYESVGKTRMDAADIEKILDEKVKELLKAGKINVKTYRNIRKITQATKTAVGTMTIARLV